MASYVSRQCWNFSARRMHSYYGPRRASLFPRQLVDYRDHEVAIQSRAHRGCRCVHALRSVGVHPVRCHCRGLEVHRLHDAIETLRGINSAVLRLRQHGLAAATAPTIHVLADIIDLVGS
jgi:hypothetical protein